MNAKCQQWKLFLCGVFVTSFIAYFALYYKTMGCLKQCTCDELCLDNNHTRSTFSEKERSKINDAEEDDDFRVDDFTSNVKQVGKIGYTRPPDLSDNTSRNQGDANTRSRPIGLVHLLDYVKYPCLPRSNHSERLRPLDRCIRTVNVQLAADTVKSVECVNLKVGPSTPICIHDPRIDKAVSGSIFATGGWEKDLLRIFVKALNKVKDIAVLDIGCNVGVYTLVAAREGKRVVSIDANVENLRLLSKSLILGQLTEQVTLIWNAVSDTYTKVSLKTEPFNVGGFYVNTDNTTISENDVIIETILLDDLMHLFEGKPVGIKMDVESFELHVLNGGMNFLKHIDVKFIQMEVVFHQKRKSGQSILTTLQHYRFVPFASCLGHRTLVDLPMKDWPIDVCFIKNI